MKSFVHGTLAAIFISSTIVTVADAAPRFGGISGSKAPILNIGGYGNTVVIVKKPKRHRHYHCHKRKKYGHWVKVCHNKWHLKHSHHHR